MNALQTQHPRVTRRQGVLCDCGVDEAGMPVPTSPPTLDAARAYLQSLATGHYENFSVLSWLVPTDLRDDFAAVYGFCRWSDDLADETGVGEEARRESLSLLAWWRQELSACFAYALEEGQAAPPRHPVFVALVETIRARGLRSEPFGHLIDAFEQDQRVARYTSWNELLDYCKGSANPVGRIVLALAGHTGENPSDADRIAMSDATCTALQLTNFWQDVRRDLLERDRIYLPSDETGIDADMLRDFLTSENDPAARIAYIRALRPLVERTRELFKEGRPLVKTLDRRIKPVVWLFGAGGEAVLGRVEKIGCATLWSRPRLPRSTKVWLIAMAAGKSTMSRLSG